MVVIISYDKTKLPLLERQFLSNPIINQKMPAYPYVPFLENPEEIRLLTIEPGEYDDFLEGGLANISLREQPS